MSIASTLSSLRGQRDEKIAHAPTTSIPRSDTWSAIKYVYDWFAALVPAVGAGPANSQYLVGASDPTLTAGRVVTNTTTAAWDLATPGQAKVSVPDGSLTTPKLAAAAFSTSQTLAENSDTVIPSQKAVKAYAVTGPGSATVNSHFVFWSDTLGRVIFDAGVGLSLDGGLSPNSDGLVPSQKAVKTYIDALATVLSGALVFKGAFDASSGLFPGAGSAQIGWFYKVSVAGTVNGQAFDVGDDIYAIVNNASASTYAANWLLIQGVLSNAEIIAALSNGAITYAKIQNVSASARFHGRITAGAGVMEELTGTQAATLIDALVGDSGSGGTKGLAPAPASGDAAANKFLKASGAWAKVPAYTETVFDATNAAWSVPAGIIELVIEGWGAGGSGGGGDITTPQRGSGGGGGGYFRKIYTGAMDATLNITIGAGGAAVKCWKTTNSGAIAAATIFTNSSGALLINWTASNLTADQPVVFTTSGSLAGTNIVAGTTYYVIATGLTANAFQVSTTRGGSAVAWAAAGSGNHTATCNADNGNVGGNTTVVGSNLGTLAANGGQAGQKGVQQGGVGGTASGGDENITGGDGTTSWSTATLAAAFPGGFSPRGGDGGRANIGVDGHAPGGGGSCGNHTPILSLSGAGAGGRVVIRYR